MKIWRGHKPAHGGWVPGALVEVARSEVYRTIAFRVDRRDGPVFVLKEDAPSLAQMISLVEVKLNVDEQGAPSLNEVIPLRNSQVWLGQVAWLLDLLSVEVDPQAAADEEDQWNYFNALSYRTSRVPMELSISLDELEVYTSLGERLPFLWPFEQLLAWAVERPNAVLMERG